MSLAEDASVLDDVVITALGLEKKKDDDLSSTSIVKVDQLKKSGEAGVLQALSGKTSGVNITRNSGDPGAGAYIQIRGQNTILGDSSPLIVIDGAIVSNNSIGGGTAGVVQQSRLNDINQEDIESISVLKGASAAAVYGTGAANGVIVIKTKRGTRGGKKWKVDYKNTFSFDQINVEWDKQGIFGQGFGGVDHLTGSGQSNTGFSYGGRIDARTGGADTVDTSGAYFQADDGTLYYPITQKNSRAVFSISITGIAGPNGGSTEKPVGTVFICFAFKERVLKDYKLELSGNRSSIREQTVNFIIDELDKLTFNGQIWNNYKSNKLNLRV